MTVTYMGGAAPCLVSGHLDEDPNLCVGELWGDTSLTAFCFHLELRAGHAPLALMPFHLHWAVGCPLSQRAQAMEIQGIPTPGESCI